MKRLSMRKIREILRLRFDLGKSHREIANSICIGGSTVADCLKRAAKAGLTWPLPSELDDEKLESMLYSVVTSKNVAAQAIDFSYIHQEMKRNKGMTKLLLWMEHKEKYSDSIGYSHFCDLYRAWNQTLDVSMRQTHVFGEKTFIDYAGMTVPMINGETGEIIEVQIFIAALGGSSYVFAEATLSQSLPDWISSHVRAFQFFGGVPELLVPDNLTSGVTSPHRYDPDINPTYQDMAEHYGVAVIPARVRKPKDKAIAEKTVQMVEQRILAPLRNHQFFGLHEINAAIRPLLDELNRRPFQKLPGSRLSQFEEFEKHTLKPLPSISYEFAEWKKATINLDYHIAFESNYYSVPYTYVKKQVDIRYTANIVEIFYKSYRIASHQRELYRKGRYFTLKEHMPEKHQQAVEWPPDRIIRWARTLGSFVALFAQQLMDARVHSQQAYRSCMGLIRLGKRYGNDRLNNACKRALSISAINYKSVETILKNNLDQQELHREIKEEFITPPGHDYVRGSEYFH